jgi:hypothetical protein
MESENEVKARRPRRSKADIEDAIHKAAVSQIKKKGFSLALVTDIVKRAKIEPVVFYNRYKNLDEFYDTFVKDYDYWLSDLVRDSIENIDSEEAYSNVIEKILNNLLSDDIMTELLRWEVAEGNNITERTARLRTMHAVDIFRNYEEKHAGIGIDVTAVSALLVAGIYYMLLHKDRSSMIGIDINQAAGKRRIVNAIREISRLIFQEKENRQTGVDGEDADTSRRRFESSCRERVASDYREQVQELIEARRLADRKTYAGRMREQGISDDVIKQILS